MDETLEKIRKEEKYDPLDVISGTGDTVFCSLMYLGFALPFIGTAAGAIREYRLDEGALAIAGGAAIGGLVGLVAGSLVAGGSAFLSGLAQIDSNFED